MKTERIQKALRVLIAILIPIIIVLVQNLTFGKFNNPYTPEKYDFWVSYIVLSMFYILLIGLTKSVFRSTLIISIFSFVFLIINQYRIFVTNEAILPMDFSLLFQATEIGSLTTGYIEKFIQDYFLRFLLLLIVFIQIVLASYYTKLKINTLSIRITTIIISLLIIILLFVPISSLQNFYLNVLLNRKNYNEFKSYSDTITYYGYYGIVGGMYANILDSQMQKPNDYSKKELEELLRSGFPQNNTEIKPNIICIFSEAFWDINNIDEITFDKNPIQTFYDLKQEGKVIKAISPSYGGMSENVTMELCTGFSMNYFNVGYIPIMNYYSKDISKNSPSIVKELKNNGYYSKILFGKDYYSSETAFKNMGFNDYYNYNIGDLKDEVIIDDIINDLKNKSNSPIFYLAETIENHMPYYIDKMNNYTINVTSSQKNEDSTNALLSYAQGIHNSVESFNKLYKFIKNFDEPTMIIFIGDHLPFIYSNESNDLLMDMDYFNTNNKLLNLYHKYNTECLILNNYNDNLDYMPEYIGPDGIFTKIINHIGIKSSNLYKWLDSTFNTLPSYNRYVFQTNNELKTYDDLSNQEKEVYRIKQQMQYYMLFDNK
jgi:hypothetical protein